MQPFIHRGWYSPHPPATFFPHPPPANPVPYFPPPSHSPRLRGALGLSSRLERPTLEDSYTKPFRCDRECQVDLRVPFADVATEQFRSEKSTQVAFTVGLVSKGTDSFTEHKCVQTTTRTPLTVDAFTLACVDDASTQTVKVTMLTNTASQTSPIELHEAATQLDLSEIISLTTFTRLAQLVKKISTSPTISTSYKRSLISDINDLSLKAEELNASFDHLQLGDVIQESSVRCVEEAALISEDSKHSDDEEEIYMSDEETTSDNSNWQNSKTRETSACSDSCANIPCPTTVPDSLCPSMTMSSLDINKILNRDPYLTSDVMLLLIQRCPTLAASPAELNLAACRELLFVQQMNSKAASEVRPTAPPGLSLRTTAGPSALPTKEASPNDSSSVATKQQNLLPADENVSLCSSTSSSANVKSDSKRIVPVRASYAKEDWKGKRSSGASNANQVVKTTAAVNVDREAPPFCEPRECKLKKSVNLTSYKPLHPENAKDSMAERDRQLVLTTARCHRSTPSKNLSSNKSSVGK